MLTRSHEKPQSSLAFVHCEKIGKKSCFRIVAMFGTGFSSYAMKAVPTNEFLFIYVCIVLLGHILYMYNVCV